MSTEGSSTKKRSLEATEPSRSKSLKQRVVDENDDVSDSGPEFSRSSEQQVVDDDVQIKALSRYMSPEQRDVLSSDFQCDALLTAIKDLRLVFMQSTLFDLK